NQGNQPLINIDPGVQLNPGGNPLKYQSIPWRVDRVDPKRLLFGTTFLYESFDGGDTLTQIGPMGPSVLPPGAWRNPPPITALAYGGWLNGQPNPDVAWVAAGSAPTNALRLRTQPNGPFNQITLDPNMAAIQAITLDPTNWQIAYIVDSNNQ